MTSSSPRRRPPSRRLDQRRLLGQALAAAGLPPITPNELRHTAATVLSDRGSPWSC